MNTIGKVILYTVGIFLVYSLITTFIHAPFMGTGSLLFLLLLACPLMFLFMDHSGSHSHGGKSTHGEKSQTIHQH